jgi:Immunity protein 22
MPNDFSSVDIWVGKFASSDALGEYLEERPEHYADTFENIAISQLAEDMEELFIDHDFECVMFIEKPNPDISFLLRESLIHSKFGDPEKQLFGIPKIADLYQQQKREAVNSIVLVYGDETNHPKSVTGNDYWLHYLGRFYEKEV